MGFAILKTSRYSTKPAPPRLKSVDGDNLVQPGAVGLTSGARLISRLMVAGWATVFTSGACCETGGGLAACRFRFGMSVSRRHRSGVGSRPVPPFDHQRHDATGNGLAGRDRCCDRFGLLATVQWRDATPAP